jgi:hypothetical protein
MDEERNVRRVGVAIADEALAGSRLVNGSSEGPSGSHRIRELRDWFDVDAAQ